MVALIPWMIVATLGGVAVALQAQFLATMDTNIGTVESVFIAYGSGGLVIGLVMLLQRGGNLAAWHGVPWYALTAGVLGLFVVGTIGYTVPRLGLVTAFTLMVAAQFIGGGLIDHFGWLGAELRPIGVSQLAGAAIMLSGVWLIIR